MSTTITAETVTVVSNTSTAVVPVAAGSKVTRLSKKDFFASLPSDMKRGAKEQAFEKYADEFSATRAAEVTGAIAAGLIRLRNVRAAKHGKSGTIGYEVVPEKKESNTVTELKARIAELEAKLATK